MTVKPGAICKYVPPDSVFKTPHTSKPDLPQSVKGQLYLLQKLGAVADIPVERFVGEANYRNAIQELLEDNYFGVLAAKKIALDPKYKDSLARWLTRHFPAFTSNSNPVKQVRNFLVDAKRAGENLLEVMPMYSDKANKLYAKLASLEYVEMAVNDFKGVVQKAGVNLTPQEINAFMVRAIEVGQHGRFTAVMGLGETAQKELIRRSDKLLSDLVDVGFSERAAKELVSSVEPITSAYDELANIGRAYGVDLEKLENIGYFNRVLTPDARFRIGKQKVEEWERFIKAPVQSISSSFQKSRNTFDWLVEDEIILGVMLGKVNQTLKDGSQSALTKAQFDNFVSDIDDTRKAIERQGERVGEFIKNNANETGLLRPLSERLDAVLKSTDPEQMTQAFKELKNEAVNLNQLFVQVKDKQKPLLNKQKYTQAQNLVNKLEDTLVKHSDALSRVKRFQDEAYAAVTPLMTSERKLMLELSEVSDATLDALVDSGVLSKLPMVSEDVYKFVAERYDTPWKGIEEYMITDPVKAFHIAQEQMSKALGKSAATHMMLRDAVEKGWGVTRAMKETNPELYGKFVPLNDEMFTRFGLSKPPGYESVYLHPTVVDMYSGVLEVASDPHTMSTFVSVLSYLNRIGKKQMLATSGFVGRQLFQVFVTSGISGTNLANLIPATATYLKLKKYGLDALDDTKKLYAGGKYTQREMVAELIKRGELNSRVSPIAGINDTAKDSFSALDPRNAGRAFGYWKSIIDQQGVLPQLKNGKLHWDALEYGADLFERVNGEAVNKFMYVGNFLDSVGKLAHYETTLRDSLGNDIGQFLTSGKRINFTDVDEAVNHARSYFFDYADQGVGDKVISQFLLPFWIYQSRNMVSVARHAIRNPRQFMAYNRLYFLANSQARQSGEDAPEGGFREYQSGYGNVYLPHPTEPGKWVHLPFTSFDPIADGLNQYQDVYDMVAARFGVLPGTVDASKKHADPNSTTMDFVDGVFKNGYGSLKNAYALATRRDPGTQRELVSKPGDMTTLAGIPVPGGKFSPLTKFMIENTLPSISNFNRFNPGGLLFGVKEQRDAKDTVVRAARPGVLGTPRSDTDGSVDDIANLPAVSLARGLGLTVNSVDVALNMQFSEADLKKSVTELSTLGKKLKERMKKEPENTKLRDLWVTTEAMKLELTSGRIKNQKWLNDRGYRTREQLERFNKNLEYYTQQKALLDKDIKGVMQNAK